MDASTSAAREAYIRCSITGILTIFAVVLRLVARTRSKARYGVDDAFIVAAVIAFTVENCVEVWATHLGLIAVPPQKLPLSILVPRLKGLMVNTLMTVLTISFAKLSVLALYHRIFSVNRKFRTALLVVAFIAIAWLIAAFFAALFRCSPVQAAWNPLIKSPHCFSLETLFAATESINCATEIVIVILPMFLLKNLQLPLRHKISVSLIFLLGGFVAIASILRIVFVYNPSASSDAISSSGMWIDIQLCCAIVCACLPVYRPVIPSFSTLGPGFSSLQSLVGRRSRTTGSNFTPTNPSHSNIVQAIGNKGNNDHYENLDDEITLSGVGERRSFTFEEEEVASRRRQASDKSSYV